jgi:hypothetical protein
MDFDPSRLRLGEWIVGAGAIVLLASMFLLKWFGLNGHPGPTAASLGVSTSANAWHAMTDLRWLMLVTIACALALVYWQATRKAPALPATASVIVTVISIVTVIALLYRVLINEPGPDSIIDRKPGAFVGLVSAIAIMYGGYRSLREEGIAERDAPASIETIELRSADGS